VVVIDALDGFLGVDAVFEGEGLVIVEPPPIRRETGEKGETGEKCEKGGRKSIAYGAQRSANKPGERTRCRITSGMTALLAGCRVVSVMAGQGRCRGDPVGCPVI
jgi:hypothetical protein